MNWFVFFAILAVYLVGLLVWRRYQFVFYLWGSLGLIIIAILYISSSQWGHFFGMIEARQVKQIGSMLGIEISLHGKTTMLVKTPSGWAGLRISVECSTYIESAILSTLILFYPLLSYRRKIKYIILGVGTLYLLNIVRLLLIVFMIDSMGMNAFTLAHGIIARFLFLMGTLLIYAIIFTRTTLSTTRERVLTNGH